MIYVWISCISFGLQDLGFNVSHHILAMKYREIAITGPFAVYQVQVPQSSVRRHQQLYWTLLALNILVSILEPFFTIPQALKSRKDNSTTLLNFLACLLPDLTGVLQLISGFLLIISLIKIRNFLSDKSKEVSMNTKTMLIHAVSFLLYILALTS